MGKNLYIILATLLGILLSSFIIALVERWIINNALSQGIQPQPYFYIYEYGYVPQYFSIGIIILGIILGFSLGHKWWKIKKL